MAVAPQPVQQPQAQAAQQQPVQAAPQQQQGIDPFGREVATLIQACQQKHAEDGEAIGRMLLMASIATGLFMTVVIGGITGALLGFTAFLILSNGCDQIYHSMRDSSYRDAADALKLRGFQMYIVNQRLPMTLDTIVNTHKQYRQYAAQQVAQANP